MSHIIAKSAAAFKSPLRNFGKITGVSRRKTSLGDDFILTGHFAQRDPSDQLLGEIETEVVALNRRRPLIQPGDRIYLEPGCTKAGEDRAILVENVDAEPLGRLPRKLVDWLGSLLEVGKIRLEGYGPLMEAPEIRKTVRHKVMLVVYQTARGNFLSSVQPTDELEAIHELVRHAYCLAQQFSNAQMILGLSGRLAGLQRKTLLPETRLLLAMLPRLVPEMHACDGLGSIAELRKQLASLSFGAAVQYGGLAFFPLCWPVAQSPSYITLDAALASGEASFEEYALAEGQDADLVVVNHSGQSLLVLEGEIMGGSSKQGIVSRSLLLAASTMASIPLFNQDDWGTRRGCRNGAATNEADKSVHTDRPQKLPLGTMPSLDSKAVGVVAAASGRILGIDLYATPASFHAFWGPLADAYLKRSQPDRPAGDIISVDDVRKFVERIAGAARACRPASGIGCEMEIVTDDFVGRALLYEGEIGHLTAFVPDDR